MKALRYAEDWARVFVLTRANINRWPADWLLAATHGWADMADCLVLQRPLDFLHLLASVNLAHESASCAQTIREFGLEVMWDAFYDSQVLPIGALQGIQSNDVLAVLDACTSASPPPWPPFE